MWDVAAKKVPRQFDADADRPFPVASAHWAWTSRHMSSIFGKSNRHGVVPLMARPSRSASHGCVQFWDAAAGKQLFPEQKPADRWGHAAFSPDGRLLLAGNWMHSCLWDSVTGEVNKDLPAGSAYGVFSPDGKQLAIPSLFPVQEDKDIPLWFASGTSTAGKELFTTRTPTLRGSSRSTSWRLLPMVGRLLNAQRASGVIGAIPTRAMVHRWDTRTGKLLGSIHRPTPMHGDQTSHPAGGRRRSGFSTAASS